MRVSQGFWGTREQRKKSKGTREHEPILGNGGSKTLKIRGRKHFDMKNIKSVVSKILLMVFTQFTEDLKQGSHCAHISAGSLGKRLRRSQVDGNLTLCCDRLARLKNADGPARLPRSKKKF